MAKLFQEFRLKNLVLKNRIVMAPMCMYSAGQDALFTPWHFAHYLTRAVGGAGAILLEATAVTPEGRITEADLGFYADEQIPRFRELVRAVKAQGTAIGIQLAHAGRKSRTSGRIVAPSALAFLDLKTPEAMTEADIERVISAFGEAARRAEEAGFDFIEIHAAHGYLINQFLSPLTNRRDDAFGRERTLFLKKVLAEVKKNWPEEKALWIRVSGEEFHPEGLHPEDLGKILKDLPVDLVDVSSGGVTGERVDSHPGYQVPFAETIRRISGLPTAAGGLITEGRQAEEILSEEKADLVYFGRELLRNPYFPLRAAKELGEDITWPKQYIRAKI